MLRNKLRYLLILAVAGWLTILYDTYYLWIIFMTLLIMPFFMFGLLCYIYGNIKLEMISTTHIVNKDELIPITIQLTNSTIFPVANIRLYLTYNNSYSSNEITKIINVSIDSKTDSTVVCNLSSEYAGNILISLKSYKILDYLKLFALKRKLDYSFKAAVLPHFYELEGSFAHKHMSISESDNYSPHKSGDDPSEVFAIRDYREGDRPQRIHWKLSTKLDRLMIKEFSDPYDCLDIIFVSLCIPEHVNVLYYIDSILECALTISYTFLLRKQPHYIAWYDAVNDRCQRVKVTQEKDFYEAVDGLLNIRTYRISKDALMTYLAEYSRDQYTDYIYITGDFTEAVFDTLGSVKASGKHILYISESESLMDIGAVPGEITQRAGDLGIDFYSVDLSNVKQNMMFIG